MKVVKKKYYTLADELLNNGVDIDHQDKDKNTALHSAIYKKDI